MDKTTPWQRVNKRKLFERFAIEIGPAVVFVIALQTVNLDAATILFVVATGVAAAYSWFEKRRFPLIPAAMVVLAGGFGALTIALGQADYIQFRATVVNGGGALAIVIALLFGKLLLKSSLQDGFRLSDGAWWTLSLRMAAYLAIMAAANEVVWRTMSVESWAWFKTISPVLNLAFLWMNWPVIRDNLHAEGSAEILESPPAGAKSAFNPTIA